MAISVQKILEEARHLKVQDRFAIAGALLRDIPEESPPLVSCLYLEI